MGSLSRTVRQLTCWSSSASSLQPWLPPQVYNPYYGSYGMYGTPNYGYPMIQSGFRVAPAVMVNPGAISHYPAAYPISYPGMISRLQAQAGTAATRDLISFGNFLELNGLFEQVATATTTAPVTTVKGNFNIQQNGILDVFSSNEAKFSMYVMSSTDLTGKNIKVNLGTGASCLAASTGTLVELAMVNAPPSINGFYISGTTTGYNIDGMNSKTALRSATNWLVLTESGTVIGCSKTALQ